MESEDVYENVASHASDAGQQQPSQFNNSIGNRAILKELNSIDNIKHSPASTKTTIGIKCMTPTQKYAPTEPPAQLSTSHENGAAIFETNSTLNKFTVDPELEAGLFDEFNQMNKMASPPKFTGLPEFDESKIPDLPGVRNEKFEATLDAQLDTNVLKELSLETAAKQEPPVVKPTINNYTHTAEDFNTEIPNSDGDCFAECQSYRSRFSDKINEQSDTDTFRSFLCDDDEKIDMNTTMECMHKSINDKHDLEEFALQINENIIRPPTSLAEAEAQHQNQKKEETNTAINISYHDEPMDIDTTIENIEEHFPNVSLKKATANDKNDCTLVQQQQQQSSNETTQNEQLPTLPNVEDIFLPNNCIEILTPNDNGFDTERIEIADKISTSNNGSLHDTIDLKPSNLTLDMTSSFCSAKSSGPSSPAFPTKSVCDLKHFPRSPSTVTEKKEMPYLEKSDYAERHSRAVSPAKQVSAISIDVMPSSPEMSTLASSVKNVDLNENYEQNSNSIANKMSFNVLDSTFDSGGDGQIVNKLNAADSNQRRTFGIADDNEIKKITSAEVPNNADEEASGDSRRQTFGMANAADQRRTFNIISPAFDGETTIDIGEQADKVMERRTFNVISPSKEEAAVDIGDQNDKTMERRTFNVIIPPPNGETSVDIGEQADKVMVRSLSLNLPTDNGDNAPMDVDDALPILPPSAYSPPIQTLQKRPPIHPQQLSSKENSPQPHSPQFDEKLSAKEQTITNAKDEKDVVVEKFSIDLNFEDQFVKPQQITAFKMLQQQQQAELAESGATSDEDQYYGFDNQANNNIILNPSDIDYLLTKGNNNERVDRSSLLLKFDPLLGVPVVANQQLFSSSTSNSQHLYGLVNNNNQQRLLSPTYEENENNHSFVLPEIPTSTAKLTNGRAKVEQKKQEEFKPPVDRSTKHAKMSVDVIDNDCNRTFDNSNTQSEDKQNNYKMDELEKKIRNEVVKTEDIEKKLKDAEQNEETLIKRITEKDKTISKMNGVIEAYEKAIAELISEKEQIIQNYETQLTEVKADRDSNYHHLLSLETTFSDLHVKYEKSKELTAQLKNNEEFLLNEKKQNLENLRLQEQRYEKMKNYAMQQLEVANKKLETQSKEHSVESTKLKALLKKEEISRASINEQLQQKSRENAELVKICDELINGQGS